MAGYEEVIAACAPSKIPQLYTTPAVAGKERELYGNRMCSYSVTNTHPPALRFRALLTEEGSEGELALV